MTAAAQPNHPAIPRRERRKKIEYACTHCGKAFEREQSLMVHTCEKKRRWEERNSETTTLAFSIYRHFYELNFPGRKVTLEGFLKSTHYTIFIRIAYYMRDTDVISIPAYTEWLVTCKVKVDQWATDTMYMAFVKHHLLAENAEDALLRTIATMEAQSAVMGVSWVDFFATISPARFVLLVNNGRLSPWVILNLSQPEVIFSRLSDEQLNLISDILNVKQWRGKFISSRETHDLIKRTLKELGL